MINKENNLTGKKVLVVDDSIMNRMVASVILNEFGMVVSEAADGEEAINILKNNTSDLVLMDLKMPIINGFKATEIIRKQMKLTMPIIALTANSMEEEKQQCLKIGMNEYVTKPFGREAFIEIISKHIL